LFFIIKIADTTKRLLIFSLIPFFIRNCVNWLLFGVFVLVTFLIVLKSPVVSQEIPKEIKMGIKIMAAPTPPREKIKAAIMTSINEKPAAMF